MLAEGILGFVTHNAVRIEIFDEIDERASRYDKVLVPFLVFKFHKGE